MSLFNTRPENMVEITIEEFRKLFFEHSFTPHESRTLRYNEDDITCGMFSCKIFAIKYGNFSDLGIIISNDVIEDGLKFYRYGEEDRWDEFKKEMGDFLSVYH